MSKKGATTTLTFIDNETGAQAVISITNNVVSPPNTMLSDGGSGAY